MFKIDLGFVAEVCAEYAFPEDVLGGFFFFEGAVGADSREFFTLGI